MKDNLQATQRAQTRVYNQGIHAQTFDLGNQMLVLLPSEESKLLAQWHGLYDVPHQLGPVTYEVRQLDLWKKQ